MLSNLKTDYSSWLCELSQQGSFMELSHLMAHGPVGLDALPWRTLVACLRPQLARLGLMLHAMFHPSFLHEAGSSKRAKVKSSSHLKIKVQKFHYLTPIAFSLSKQITRTDQNLKVGKRPLLLYQKKCEESVGISNLTHAGTREKSGSYIRCRFGFLFFFFFLKIIHM